MNFPVSHPCRQHLQQRAWRVFAGTVTAALLCFLTGCALSKNEEDGDQEPRQAEYRVVISPSSVTLSSSNPAVTVSVSASCAGNNLPVGCDPSFDPLWEAQNITGTSMFYPEVTLLNPHSQSTTAEVRLTPSDFAAPYYAERFWEMGVPVLTWASITPTLIPADTELTGKMIMDIIVDVPPPPGGVRTEESADRGVLRVFPSHISAKPPANFDVVNIVYKGPPAFLTDISIGGADPGKFSLGVPALPLFLDKNSFFTIQVNLVNSLPAHLYRADITIRTDNGLVKVIHVEFST